MKKIGDTEVDACPQNLSIGSNIQHPLHFLAVKIEKTTTTK